LENERSFFKEPWLWLIFLFYLALAAFSFNRGLFLSDEGYQQYYSWLMTIGQKIYKDFFLTVAPLAYMIQAALIKIFGVKLIVSRVYAAVLGVAGFFAIAYISKKAAPGKYWLLSAALYIIFSNNLINISQHCVMSKHFFVFSLALALYWFESGSLPVFFCSGLFAGMASFSYQSLVAVAGAQLVLCLWYKDRTNLRAWLKPALFYCAGFAVIAVIVFLYLAQERLLEESVQLLVFGNRKQHVLLFLFKYILPIIVAVGVLNFVPVRVRFIKYNTAISAVMQGMFIVILCSILANVFENLSFTANVLSWVLPIALFSAAYACLLKEKASGRQMLVFYICALFFPVGLLGGYDIGHNLSSALLLIPWTGYLAGQLVKSGPKKILTESAVLPVLMALLVVGLATMVVWRWEFWGEVAPLYRCNSELELKTARGIYTSPEQKQELETLVAYIQGHTAPGDKILIYPNQLLIYYLAERPSLSKAPFFYYETTDLGELQKAATLSKANKTPVIFQLKDGKIFQPLNSAKAEGIIEDLLKSCSSKIELKDYLICAL
jgi:hypothetical protein